MTRKTFWGVKIGPLRLQMIRTIALQIFELNDEKTVTANTMISNNNHNNWSVSGEKLIVLCLIHRRKMK